MIYQKSRKQHAQMDQGKTKRLSSKRIAVILKQLPAIPAKPNAEDHGRR
jgi:hypothetical protein